jgi:nucleoside-triphosphatase
MIPIRILDDGTFMYSTAGRASGLGVIWLVTGPPGVGKSTLVSKVILRLKSAGVIVGGCTTFERRSKGARVGFDVLDLSSERKGELASLDSKLGPRVGRYRVNLTDLAEIGAVGLNTAANSSELIVIDEVGPMELVSPEFRRAVRKCIESGKPILAVVHERLEDDLLSELRTKAQLIATLSVENRDTTAEELGSTLLAAVGGPKTS